MTRRYLCHTTLYLLDPDGSWTTPRVPHEPAMVTVETRCTDRDRHPVRTLGAFGDDDLAVVEHLRSIGAREAHWSLSASAPHRGNVRNDRAIGVGRRPGGFLRYLGDDDSVQATRFACPTCPRSKAIEEEEMRVLLSGMLQGQSLDISKIR